MVALTFLVGHIADRLDRRRIVATCQFVECIVMALLTLGDRDGKLDVSVLFAAVALLGAARAFETPTMSALLPALVPEALLPKAFAVSSSAMQTATIVGPSLGGLLYAAGASVPLGVSALCLLAASGAMAFIKMERTPPKREPISFQSVFSGVSFIRSRPIILGAISLDLFAVFLEASLRCCLSLLATSCTPALGVSDFCARPRRREHSRCPFSSCTCQ